jgi:hypothetical protein
MTSISNSVGTVAGFRIRNAGTSLYSSSGEIATGKSNYQPTDYVIGSKLEDTSKILDSVARVASYGCKLLTSAQSQLISIGTHINKLQTLIIQADTACPEVLAQLNLLYQDGV